MIPEHPDDDGLIGYALGDLGVSERGAVDAHLHTCEGCRSQVEQLEGLLRLVRTPQARAAPIHILVGLLGKQKAARRRSGMRRTLAPWIAAAALGMLFFAAGYMQGLHGTAQKSDAVRRTVQPRAPLPPPPPIALEPAVAAVNNLLWPAPGARPASVRDSSAQR